MSDNHHSQLAMKAARRIGRAKQKEKVGRTICYHLLMMIEQEQSTGRSGDRAAHGRVNGFNHVTAFNSQAKGKRKQFSLGL
jgi:hypothetical protein